MNYNKCLSGVLCGGISSAVFYPIDVLRIRYFFNTKNKTNLFNGIKFTISSGALKSLATFPTQDIIRQKLIQREYTKIQSDIYSGILTGVILSTIATPINCIKVPLQDNVVNTTRKSCNIIYKNNKLLGFYKGFIPMAIRDIGWSAVYFSSFGLFNNNLNPYLSSCISAVFATIISYPIDGMRLYQQNNKKNISYFYGFKKSFSLDKNNIKSFGFAISRVPISVVLNHSLYLLSNEFLKKY